MCEFQFYFPYNNITKVLEKNKKKNFEKEKLLLKNKEKEAKKLDILTQANTLKNKGKASQLKLDQI
jgi:hypothetical protein